jgi:hypothetical protein
MIQMPHSLWPLTTGVSERVAQRAVRQSTGQQLQLRRNIVMALHPSLIDLPPYGPSEPMNYRRGIAPRTRSWGLKELCTGCQP